MARTANGKNWPNFKQPTQGKRMAEWESQRDFAYWRDSFDVALAKQDYIALEALVLTGIEEGYRIPDVSHDGNASSIVSRLMKNYN